MKEIKAFMHRGRAADVIHALLGAGFTKLSVTDVKGTLKALTEAETDYSVEFGSTVITEIKVEIVCEAGQVPSALEILRQKGHSRRPSGWAYVMDIEQAVALDD